MDLPDDIAEGEMEFSGHLETHLRQAQEIATVGSWQLDVPEGELFWSEECYRIFGIDPGTPMTYERFLDVVHPADRESVEAQWDAALAGTEYDIEHRIVVDGEAKWVREKADVSFDERGDPSLAVGVVKDITETKDRERRLQSSTHRYQALIEAAPDPIFVAAVETGEIIETNGAGTEFLGRSREDILGMDQAELHPKDKREEYRRLFEDHVQAGGARRHLPDGSLIYVQTADGTEVPVEINVETIDLPDGRVIYGIFRDIREQLEREQELRRFQKAVEAAGHSIYITATDGSIEYVNPAFEENTGYPADIALGQKPNILKSGVHGEEVYEELWSTILDGAVWRAEMINRNSEGAQYTVNQTIAPVLGEGGEIDRFVAVNSDITDLKRREEMLEAERDRAEALRQRLSVVNRIIRHDIRSAVNIIKGNAELATETPEDIALLENVQEEAERLYRISENTRLIENSLGDAEFSNAKQDISALLDRLLRTLADRHPALTIHDDVHEDVVAEVDERFGAALENVLVNAVDHNDTSTPEIWVGVHRDAAGVEVEIADNGPGIPDAELEPLGQDMEDALHHTSGLGLWIVYWVVERSGGTVTFEQNVPRGTVVTMSFPA